MQNINVITNFLQKEEMLTADGEVRPVILSELGYSSSQGEINQAAAFAYAYYAAENNPYINAILLSRQTDAGEEIAQGLSLIHIWGACSRCAVSRCSSTCNAESDNGQKAFKNHCAVTNLEHILFICDCLGRSVGGYQAVEAGDRTAGNGYEQDRKHVSELFICKSCINRQVHGRMCNEQSENSADDHANEHVSGHHITGLFEQPDRKNCCEEDINKGDVSPGIFSGGDRKLSLIHILVWA